MKKVTELKEIREKDTKALVKELADLNKKMAELQFKTSFRRLKNFHEITDMRKRTARIWTVLNEKAIAEFNNKESK
ncbi:TPA: 50S ribosomal protein L29 [Candidatus Berkelbacteria bacterium]|uniref:Large ribosomal subunit protein uL29 n=1 Tax=Berkelbacteria bacterium GW2011_GWE1_39_12 TaxID=1618337 RepID=A0A0G4B5I5_9BACT|nr:MAG: 50S ribosomal protein L29 [Berkelbacteria bacterium GW2011_GWE1_39_12]HBO60220.1 50S ribosomal protein L29 [Candidatus Berkelbacteria bacterium]